MPWPADPLPTLGEFVARVEAEFDCHVGDDQMAGPRGVEPLRYLVREFEDGHSAFAVLPNIPDDARLTPDVMRNLCDVLELPAAQLGLVIRL